MKIKLIREVKTDLSSIGSLYINDKYFCKTLEPFDAGLMNIQRSQIFTKPSTRANVRYQRVTIQFVWIKFPQGSEGWHLTAISGALCHDTMASKVSLVS